MNTKLLIGLYKLSKYMREYNYQRIGWVTEMFLEQYPDSSIADIQKFLIMYSPIIGME